MRLSKPLPINLNKKPCESFFLRMREAIMGVRERETMAEIMIDPATTIPNSLKSLPVRPCKKTIGKNTTTKVTEVATMAKNISSEPL